MHVLKSRRETEPHVHACAHSTVSCWRLCSPALFCTAVLAAEALHYAYACSCRIPAHQSQCHTPIRLYPFFAIHASGCASRRHAQPLDAVIRFSDVSHLTRQRLNANGGENHLLSQPVATKVLCSTQSLYITSIATAESFLSSLSSSAGTASRLPLNYEA
jgi:hypothetical protein